MMPRKLVRVKINRVDLVDKGANQHAEIVLTKRDVQKDSPSLSSVHVDTAGDERDEYEKAILSSESRNALPDSAFAAVWTDASGKKQRKLPYRHADGSIDSGHLTAALGRIDGADIPSDKKAAARRKLEAASGKKGDKSVEKNLMKRFLTLFGEKDVEKRDAEIAELAKAVDAAEPDADDSADGKDGKKKKPVEKDDMMMSKMNEVTKQLDDLKKENEELKKSAASAIDVAKAEKEARLDREMVDVLKSFKATPFIIDMADPKNDVTKFRKMKEADPDGYSRTMELFKAADAQLAETKLFGEPFGTSRSGTASAWSQIEAKADAMIEKSTNSLSKEQAIEKVMFANPALVKQYRMEQQ